MTTCITIADSKVQLAHIAIILLLSTNSPVFTKVGLAAGIPFPNSYYNYNVLYYCPGLSLHLFLWLYYYIAIIKLIVATSG